MTTLPLDYAVLDNGDDIVLAFSYVPFIESVRVSADGSALELVAPQTVIALSNLPARVRRVLTTRGALCVGLDKQGQPRFEHRLMPLDLPR